MALNILEKNRRASTRKNPNAFDEWVLDNCVKTVPYNKLPRISRKKKKILEQIIKGE